MQKAPEERVFRLRPVEKWAVKRGALSLWNLEAHHIEECTSVRQMIEGWKVEVGDSEKRQARLAGAPLVCA